MGKSQKTSNQAASGIRSVNSGKDAYIQKYYETVYNGGTAAEATQAARNAAMPNFDETVAQHSANTSAAQKLQSGEYYRNENGRIINKSAEETYAQRVMAAQAQNSWAESGKGVYSPDNSSDAYRQSVYDEAEKRAAQIEEGNDKLGWLSGVGNTIAAWINQRTGSSLRTFGTMNTVGSQTDINRKPTSIAGVTVSNVNLSDDQVKTIEEAKQKQAVYGQALTQEGDIQASTSAQLLQDVKYGKDKYGAGNIDLTKRPLVENEDGTVSTVYSMSFEEDGKEILIPTVIPVNGQWMIVDNQTAIDYYHQTGEYLGKFDTIAEANEYANAIHEQQQKMIEGKATSTGAAVRGFLSQAATSYADVIADAGVNMLTGGAGLLAMSTRAGINEAANARLEGKDQVTQLKTGLKSGIIEYITEVAGGALDFAYGPSFLSDITDKVIAKVTSKYGTRIALRLASSGVEEALEEIMSGILNPMADRILKLDDGTGSWVKNIDWEETLYEGLIGGTIGLLGAGVNGDTYAKESVYDPYGEGAQDIIDAAKQSSSFRARKMADKYSADTLTNKQADRLMNAGNTADIYANTVMQRAQEAQQAQNQALTVQDNAQKRQNAVNQFMGQNGMQQTSSSVQTEGVEVNTPSGGKAIFSGLAVQNGEIVAKLTNADGSVTYDSRENVEQALPADTTAFIENVVTAFGENAAAVYAMYDPAQNANDYIAGMSEAINLYAANGVNPKQAAQNARAQAAQETGDENSSASLVATLNDTQLDYANSVGQEMYDAKVDAAQQKTQEYTAAMEALDDANGMERRAEGSAVETQRRQNIADRIDAAYAAGVAEYNDWRGQYDSTVQQMNRYTPGSAEYNSLLQQANTIAEESDKLAGELTNLKEQREQARANLKEAQQKEAAAKKARDERKAQREAYNKKRNGKKGSISFDGGNVNGTTYNAVDFNKLNRTQKKSVKIIEQLTDAVSVDFVLFDGDAKGDQGVYLSGGKIYVNVNAGMAIEKVLALFTVSHEMTHMLSEMAPEDFLAITKFIIEHDGQGVFDKRVRQIMATQGLDYDAAVEEYVCQACTRMLENSKAIEELFRQNMSLGERIVEFLKEIIANIKAVFAEADGFNFAEAKAVEAYTDELQALWDSALYNAEYNLQAMRETEYIRRAQQSMQGDENGASEMDAEDPAKMQKWELMTEEEQNVEIAKNKAFNDSKTVTGSNLKTLRGSDLKRGGTLKGHKYPLGKIVGDQLYFEKSYVDQIAEADSTFKELYTEAVKKLHEAYPDFNFKGVMYETKTGKIAFQESPDFDTAREPITGRQVNVPMGGDAEMAKGGKPYMQIWHHKWMWVDNNYSGFDVDKAWQWSKQFASTIIGVPNGAHMEAWNKQLDSFGLPHDDVKFQKWEETDTVEQKATSADTSLNQLPSLFTNKYAEFVPFGVNIDIGGGKYDKASEYLQGLGVENKVFDPYNRSEEVNTETLNWLMRGNKADTASCANVLNVISSPEARANVILEMAKAIKPDGAAYFVVYEGDGTGNSRDTTKGWQEHRKTDTYVPEIEAYFDDVQRKGKLIIAKNPKANLPAAAWEVTAGKGVKFQKWAQYEWYNDKTRENESRESQMITEEDRAYFRDLISERMNSHIKPGMTEEEIYAQKIKNLQDYIREYGDSLTYEQEQDINEQITALYYHKDPYDEFDSFELSRIEEFEKNAKFQKWDDMSYEELKAEKEKLYEEMNDVRENNNILKMTSGYSQLMVQFEENNRKIRNGIRNGLSKEEIKTLHDENKVLKEKIDALRAEYRIDTVANKERQTEQIYKELLAAMENAWIRESNERENKRIEESGLSPEDYFREKSLEFVGTTNDFNEAGYLLPDGRMLDFSGKKEGGTPGRRSYDHRDIAGIYEATYGSEAMYRFEADGNIRMMPEGPGIEINAFREPTAEQYEKIREFVRELGEQEGQFYTDITDPQSERNSKSLFYPGSPRADLVVNEIKSFFRTGTVREQNTLRAFYQKWDAAMNDWNVNLSSKLESVLDDPKLPNRMMAEQVEKILLGKMVTPEEFKWSGIPEFLEGKTKVTKDELKQVVQANRIEIKTEILDDSAYEQELEKFKNQTVFVDDETGHSFLESGILTQAAYSAGIPEYNTAGLHIEYTNTIEPDVFRFAVVDQNNKTLLTGEASLPDPRNPGPTWIQNTNFRSWTLDGPFTKYREILFSFPDSNFTTKMGKMHWGSDRKGIFAHARIDERIDKEYQRLLFIEEIQSDWHNAGKKSKLKFVTKDANRYRELVKERYSRELSEDENAEMMSLQKKVNPSRAEQFSALKEFNRIKEEAAEALSISLPKRGLAYDRYNAMDWIKGAAPSPWSYLEQDPYNPGSIEEGDQVFNSLTKEEQDLIVETRNIYKKYQDFQYSSDEFEIELKKSAPDAPYAGAKDSYVPFVMKNLLQMAAQQGYDGIAWTTAEQQDERWADGEYHEPGKGLSGNLGAYTIEYDQNMKKFMDTFGKKYGTKTEQTVIDIGNGNNGTAWVFYLWDDMKENIIAGEGMTKFQKWNPDELSMDEWAKQYDMGEMKLRPDFRQNIQDFSDAEYAVKNFFRKHFGDTENWPEDEELFDYWMQFDFEDGVSLSAMEVAEYIYPMLENLWGNDLEEAYDVIDRLAEISMPRDTFFLYDERFMKDKFGENLEILKKMRRYRDRYNELNPGEIVDLGTVGMMSNTSKLMYRVRGTYGDAEYTYDEIYRQMQWKAIREGKLIMDYRLRRSGEGELGGDLYMQDPATGEIVFRAEPVREIKKNSRKAGQMAMFQKWEQESMQDDTNEESRARATANVTQQTGKRLAQEMIADLNKELKQARKDAEAAGVTIEQLRRELKLTDKPEVREKDARKLANKLAKEYGSKVDRAEIANMIKELGDYIVQSTADSIDYVVLEKSTKKIAEKVLGSVETVSEEEAAKLDYVQQIASRIKGSKFTLAEQDRGELDGGYNEFRKRNFGRFTLGEGGSAVDSFYKELQSEFGVTNYLPELNNPGEMLQQFELIFNEAKPELVNPFADYWTEAVNSTANDILYDVIGDTLRQMPPTFADKAQAKLDRQKAKDREKLDAVKEELRDTRREKTRLEKKLDKAEARYQNLKETKDKRIQEIIRNGKARRAEAIAKEKAEKWKKVKAVRDFYREKAKREHENRKENAAVKKLRNKVIEKAGRLYKWLTENSGKHHIPESLKKPVSELLLEIDFTSKRSLNGGDETASDRSFAARMNELRDILQRQMNAQNGVEDAQNVFNGYMDLPLGVLDQMADIVKAANVVAESGGTFTVNEMNSEQLGTLNDILDVMTAAVKQINALHASNLYAGVDEAGRETIDEMKAKKPLSEKLMMKNGKKPAAAVANDFMLWENMVPVYAFGRYGKAGRNMFDGLRRGWGTFARDTQQLIEFTKQVYTAEEVQQWRNEKKTVGMVNQKGEFVDVKMSVPEIMGLYELMKRGQALQHMLAGGIQVPSSSVDHNAVDVQILNNITSLLTDRQRAVADALQTYMQKTGGEWGNEVTMKRWGIRQFGEEHYYPIETDSSDRNADASLDAQGNKKLSLYRIMNMGFTKGLNKHANNAIVIRDIFDVFANHMSDMAKYHGLTLPMLDILKWYNYREKVDVENSDSGQYTTESVQRAIEKVYGRAANNYFMQFMKDVNGVNDGGTSLEGIAKAAMGAYKVAQIGFNLRVVIQQPTSIARAMVLMDPKWLARGVVTKGDFDEMMEHSGLAVWKIGLGFYDVNTNAGIRKKIANDMTRREDIQEKSTWLAGKADEVTWTAIWRACKAEAIAKGVPDEILMDVVTERFENLILETQVMDSTITRSQIMRSKSLFVNEYTGFMSEPTLTYNVLLDSYLKFRDMWSKTDFQTAWKQQGANVMKTLNVFAISAALTAAAESIMDANRDDDDYETWLQKYRQHFLENFKDNMNPFQLVPVIADVWDMLEQLVTTGSYSSDSTMDKAGLTKLISSGKKLYQLITEGSAGNYTAYGVLYSTMQGLGMVLGLPIAPAVRELTSFYNGAATIYNDILGNRINEPLPHLKTYDRGDKQNIRDAYDNGYLTEEEAQQKLVETGEAETAEDAMKQTYKWETGSTNMYEPLYNAVKSGDGETVNLIRERMASMGYTENEINGKIKQKISEWYTDTTVSMDRATAVDALVLYAGMTRTDAEARCAYDWFYNEHPEANVDGKSSVTQDELGQTLRAMERNGQLTRSEAEQLWLGRTAGDTNPWKKTYSEWVSKNK